MLGLSAGAMVLFATARGVASVGVCTFRCGLSVGLRELRKKKLLNLEVSLSIFRCPSAPLVCDLPRSSAPPF